MLASRFLLTVFIILTALIFYMGYQAGHVNYALVILMVVLVISSYVFQHPINQWWDQRFGVKIEKYEDQWMDRALGYLKEEDPEKRNKLKENIIKMVRHTEFIPMGEFPIPEEMKIMAIAPATILGIDWKSKTAKHFQRVVFYKHPFITPMNEQVHVYEIHEDDGVIIFCTEHLQMAHLHPKQYFNIALYAWIELALKYKKELQTDLRFSHEEMHMNESKIKEELGYGMETLKQYLGVIDLNKEALEIYIYLLNQ